MTATYFDGLPSPGTMAQDLADYLTDNDCTVTEINPFDDGTVRLPQATVQVSEHGAFTVSIAQEDGSAHVLPVVRSYFEVFSLLRANNVNN